MPQRLPCRWFVMNFRFAFILHSVANCGSRLCRDRCVTNSRPDPDRLQDSDGRLNNYIVEAVATSQGKIVPCGDEGR